MMKPGKPKSVREIVSTDTYKQEQAGSWKGKNDEHQDQDPMCALGDSVRTVGRLKAVLSVETVVIEDEGHELEVDVSLSTPCHFKRGSQYQFIGELEDRRNSLGNDVSKVWDEVHVTCGRLLVQFSL